MWDFFETARHRHSVRSYQADMPVEREKLHAVLEAACSAPSAGSLQSYRIVVVEQAATRRDLAAAAGDQAFLAQAPVCLVFCADRDRSEQEYGERGASLYALQDATIAASYAELAAVAAGLASAWVGLFEPQRIREALSLEPQFEPVAMVSVGYPAELPEVSSRRRLDDVVTYR